MNGNYLTSGSRRSGTWSSSLHLVAAGIGAALLMLGSPELRADEYDDTIKVFKKAGESGEFFEKSYGYAVFPTIGKGGMGIGGAHGKGRVYGQGKYVGDATMTQLTVGLPARRPGVQPDHLLRGQARIRRVHRRQLRVRRASDRGGDHGRRLGRREHRRARPAGASGGKNDATTVGRYHKGMAVFTVAKGGLMYEASVGGQKFKYKPLVRTRARRGSPRVDQMSSAASTLTGGIVSAWLASALVFASVSTAAETDGVAVAISAELDALLNPEVTTIQGANIALGDYLREFYSRREFRAVWSSAGPRQQLLKALDDSYDDGLDPADYHLPLLRQLAAKVSAPDATDTLKAQFDILLTEALLRLGYHLSFGKVDPETFDAQWNYGRTLPRTDVAAKSRTRSPPATSTIAWPR